MEDDQIDKYVPQCSNILWYELDKNLKDNNLFVLTVNARSITGKFADLIIILYLVRKRFTFIIMTESWLTKESFFIQELNEYKSHTLKRVGRTGGGIKIFCLEYVRTEVISQSSAVEDSYESFLFKAAIPGLVYMFVAGIYWPPNTPIADFTHIITNTLEYTDNCRAIFSGDFNIDVSRNSNTKRNYVDTFHQYGLINEIDLLTYFSPSTGIDTYTIDHQWHILSFSRRSYVSSPALSGHYALCVHFRINYDSAQQSMLFRDFSEANAELLALIYMEN